VKGRTCHDQTQRDALNLSKKKKRCGGGEQRYGESRTTNCTSSRSPVKP